MPDDETREFIYQQNRMIDRMANLLKRWRETWDSEDTPERDILFMNLYDDSGELLQELEPDDRDR